MAHGVHSMMNNQHFFERLYKKFGNKSAREHMNLGVVTINLGSHS